MLTHGAPLVVVNYFQRGRNLLFSTYESLPNLPGDKNTDLNSTPEA